MEVGDYVEEMPDGRLPEPVNVIRRRSREASLHDHSAAAAGVIVARRAIDVVALPPALEIFVRDGKGKAIGSNAILFAGVQQFIQMQMAARHRAGDGRALGATVVEESSGLVR